MFVFAKKNEKDIYELIIKMQQPKCKFVPSYYFSNG